MGAKGRGQVLVILAAFLPVAVLLFFFALGMAALQDVRAHASYALGVATRAGARRVDYAGYGQDTVRFAADVAPTVRDTFREALALRPAGLGAAPEEIAAAVEVAIGYGSTDVPWVSPFGPRREHRCPTVAAYVRVPVRVFLFEVAVPIVSETEVR